LNRTGKVFTTGRSQGIRRPETWDSFFAALERADVPADFLAENERKQAIKVQDPFEGWTEDD